MVYSKHQRIHQFQHLLHPLLLQEIMKYVHYNIKIHEKIKYSEFYKNQARYDHRASDVMNTQIKILPHKTWHYVIVEYFLKNKAMEQVYQK